MQRIPQIWPGWQADELIGRGAYGKVYRASNDAGEQAAIKVIEIPQDEMEVAELQRMGMDALSVRLYFEDTARAVSNEIKVMERLRDAPHVVRIQAHELIEREAGVGWSVFIRMELLEPLVRRLDEQGLPSPREAARIGRDLCDALRCCHEAGVIHRDVKPENVFCDATGAYKLGDFGIAKRMDTATRSTMSFAGSRPYMAPEVEGGHYDASVDTYSLGLMLYRWLNGGRPPFLPATGSVSQQQIQRADLDRLTFKEPPLPAGDGTDPALAGIVLRAIAPHAQDRWESAEAFGEALQSWLDGGLESARNEDVTHTQPERPQPHEDEVATPPAEKVSDKPKAKASKTVRKVTPIASDATSGKRNAGAKAKPSTSLPVSPRILAVAAAVIVALIVVVLSLPGPTIVDPPLSDGGSSSSTSTTSSSNEDTEKESSSSTSGSTSSSKPTSSSSSSSTSKTSDTSSSSSTTEGKNYQAPYDPSDLESDSSSSQTDSSSSSSSGSSETHQVDTTSITHYDCGYFSIDVPESWKGSWTLVEGPGNQWSVWSFYAGQAVLKLGNGNTKEYEIVGTVDYGNGEPIGLMMDNDGFFGDGLATLSPNYY